MAVRVEPQPDPGDEVVLGGSFCGTPQGHPGEPLTCSFTATEHDVDPPPTITRSFHNLFDPNPGESTCFPVPELAWYVHVELDGPASSGATPEFLVVEAYDDETASTLVRTRSVEFPEDGMVEFHEDTQLADPRNAFCFRAWTFDGAGNVTEPTPLVCLPCHERRQPPGETTDEWDFDSGEPEWEDWERVPGGPCDDGNIPQPPDDTGTGTTDDTGPPDPGTGTTDDTGSPDPDAGGTDASGTGGEGADDDGPASSRGCACSTMGSPAHHRGFAPLLVLALVAVKRRSG
jgi:MYXO-CTERM domain-containing protein